MDGGNHSENSSLLKNPLKGLQIRKNYYALFYCIPVREREIILMLVTLLLLTPSITLAETRTEETDIVYPEDVGGGPGDIVLIAYNLPECLGSNWGHAQIYLGNYSINDGNNAGDGNFADADRHKVVETTFYSGNWGLFRKFRYYWIAFRVIMGWGIGSWTLSTFSPPA